ncbi:MAG: hypothetical protein AVDCRST_MAG20-389 [uncultured Acidimicrobiales bacterium]|uniref:Uncharacterized protein n=1 Tax=uncultured Acidimicrobiales bacterium TaxID=310071 RepID=A0A6J4H913_9ACTN|nr:MAG: hypothetical protein AVDCRST_MAG20-389 [uncultured Acidimicrobiales bacterium]
MAALEDLEPRVRNALGEDLAVGDRRDPVVAAGADERRARDLAKSARGVVRGAGLELAAATGGEVGVVGADCGLGVGEGPQLRHLVGVGRLPRLVPPHVRQRQVGGEALVGRQRLQLVEGVGRAACATARRARQHEPVDEAGMTEGELLGHHPAEGDAEHVGLRPADGVQQVGSVVGVLRHRVRLVRLVAAALTPLVVGEHLEVRDQRPVEHVRLGPQVAAGATDVEQPGAGARPLVVEVDRHGPIMAPLRDRSPPPGSVLTDPCALAGPCDPRRRSGPPLVDHGQDGGEDEGRVQQRERDHPGLRPAGGAGVAGLERRNPGPGQRCEGQRPQHPADDDDGDAHGDEPRAPRPVPVEHEGDAGDQDRGADDVVVALAEPDRLAGPGRRHRRRLTGEARAEHELDDVRAEPGGDARDVEDQQPGAHGGTLGPRRGAGRSAHHPAACCADAVASGVRRSGATPGRARSGWRSSSSGGGRRRWCRGCPSSGARRPRGPPHP